MGNAKNEIEMALLYYNNKGVKDNYERAASFLRGACKKEDPLGYALLASMYVQGDIEKDSKKGLEYFERACELGHIESCYNAALMYGQGEGTEIDYKRALELLEISSKEAQLGCELYNELKEILDLEEELLKGK